MSLIEMSPLGSVTVVPATVSPATVSPATVSPAPVAQPRSVAASGPEEPLWLLRVNPLLGALVGLLIGHAFDADWFRSPRDNPYRVLGLTDEATDAEVDLAYRRLITQYHPDKLAGAADELRRQAEARAREINGAYDRIQTLRKRG